MASNTTLRIVLVGKTGAGKSSTGNTMLGRDAFKAGLGHDPITSAASRERGKVAGRPITVCDTPGIFDPNQTNYQLKCEIGRCIQLSLPGPHVFLLVIRLDVRFTDEERKSVKWIQNYFGDNAALFTMVLFTHGDALEGQSERDLFNDEVLGLIGSCGGGYHVFNNQQRDDRTQVEELIRKIDAMVGRNGGGYYTSKVYQQVRTIEDFVGAIAGGIGGGLGGATGGAVGGALVGALAGALVGLGQPAAIAAGAAQGALRGAAAGGLAGAGFGIYGGYTQGGIDGGESGGRIGGYIGTLCAALVTILSDLKAEHLESIRSKIGKVPVGGAALANISKKSREVEIQAIQIPGYIGGCVGGKVAEKVEDVAGQIVKWFMASFLHGNKNS